MPGSRKKGAPKKGAPKRGAAKKGKKEYTIVDKIRDEVVAELKPHIDEMRDAAKTEIRQIRSDILNAAPTGEPPAQPAAQPAAAPVNPEVISGLLQSFGAKPDQISQVMGAITNLQTQNPAGAAAPAALPSPTAQAPPTPQDRQWQLMMMILPMLLGQGQGSPILAELAQRSLLDSLAFATTMQRAAVSKIMGGMMQGIGRDAAGVGVPGLEDYLRASNQYMGPIIQPNMPQGGGPPTGTTPAAPPTAPTGAPAT